MIRNGTTNGPVPLDAPLKRRNGIGNGIEPLPVPNGVPNGPGIGPRALPRPFERRIGPIIGSRTDSWTATPPRSAHSARPHSHRMVHYARRIRTAHRTPHGNARAIDALNSTPMASRAIPRSIPVAIAPANGARSIPRSIPATFEPTLSASQCDPQCCLDIERTLPFPIRVHWRSFAVPVPTGF